MYSLEVESIEYDSTNFLDFNIRWDPQNGISYWPYRKATSQHRPLSAASGHTPATHQTWPVGELKRLARRSSSSVFFEKAKEGFIQKMQYFFAHESVISRLQSTNPFTFRPQRLPKEREVWLVLPYHPVICMSGFGKSLGILTERWKHVLAELRQPTVRLGWKNHAQCILAHIRRIFDL